MELHTNNISQNSQVTVCTSSSMIMAERRHPDQTHSHVPPQSPNVAILSSPGMGHLIPVIALANLLIDRHPGLAVTLITFSNFTSPSSSSLLSSLPPSIRALTLPFISLSDLPPSARIETLISHLVVRSIPSLSAALTSLNNLVAYIIDLFGSDTLSVAKQLNIPHYIFFTSNLLFLSFSLNLPALDASTSCEYRDLETPLMLPGCVPLRGEDFTDTVQDRSDEAYKCVVQMGRNFRLANGILVNSFEAMEPDVARFMMKDDDDRPPVYTVGPVIRPGSTCGTDRSGCLGWLDRQPAGSVIFVSFGSGGNLSCGQTTELALGLEMSGKRFLWVARTPSDYGVAAGFVWMGADGSDSLDYLPHGFRSRNRDVGMVVADWAPQAEVLAHDAVGGFLTHCGWNSTLESVMSGRPMIAWPLYAEQRMNAVMLADGPVKVAVRPRVGGRGIVEREEVCRVVKQLMEGEEGKLARRRVQETQKAGVEAMLQTDGSSATALADLVKKWIDKH